MTHPSSHATATAGLRSVITTARRRRSTARVTAATLCLLGITLSTAFAYAANAPTLSPKWVVHLEESETCSPEHPAYDFYQATLQEVQHDRAGNIHVNANGTLRSYTRDGALRWVATQCPGCVTAEDRGNLRPFAVMPSGEVWALEARSTGANDSGLRFALLHRLDASGATAQTLALAGTAFEGRDTLLRATADGAVLVSIVDHTLHMLRVRNGAVTASTMPLASDRDSMGLLSAAVLGYADIVVQVVAFDEVFCLPGIPCDTSDYSLMRLSAHDGLVWRQDMVDPRSALTFAPDGSMYFVSDFGNLVSVTAEGHVTSTTPAPDADIGGEFGIAGPLDGYLLLGGESLVSVDLAGHIGGRLEAEQEPYRYPWLTRLAQTSSEGVVVPLFADPLCHAAALYTPSTLTERHRLHVEGTTCVTDPTAFEGPATANLIATTADGGITLLRQECGEGSEPTILARFGIPGTPAGDLLMRDDFERPGP